MELDAFSKRILEKIKNKEDLDYNEIQAIERLLWLSSFMDHILDIQIGLKPNDLDLEFVKKRNINENTVSG